MALDPVTQVPIKNNMTDIFLFLKKETTPYHDIRIIMLLFLFFSNDQNHDTKRKQV